MSEPLVTNEMIKAFLERPMVLLLLMLCGVLGSAFKQMSIARRAGTSPGFRAYFRDYWPETLVTMGGVVIAFLTMVSTDTLNFASAILGGFTANSAADLFTKQGRSDALKGV